MPVNSGPPKERFANIHDPSPTCGVRSAPFSSSPVLRKPKIRDLAATVDDYVKAEMQRQHIPGLSLLIAKDGKIVRAQGFGLANVELQVPAKPETIFQSGSVGKQFTATAVMMLVEEGKIGLDDPLTKYFPDAPADLEGSDCARVVESHRRALATIRRTFNFRKDWTEDELLKLVEGIPLAYAPGTKWDYSNLGYLTLGILIHRVTGEFYGDFLQQRIFHPLEMNFDAHHQRSRHHSQSRSRISPGERRIEESGVGRSDDQYDRRRKPLLLGSRSRASGMPRSTPKSCSSDRASI